MGSAISPLQQSLVNYDVHRYWTSRDYHTSSRWYLQHWIWKYQTGYDLHPSIHSSKHGLRVADVGTGNAYVRSFLTAQAFLPSFSSFLRLATTTAEAARKPATLT